MKNQLSSIVINHQLLNIKLSKPLHLILILIHVSLFRYNKLILCLLILHMVLYLSINFNFKKKLKRNTLETHAFWASLVIVSLPWMFMGEERYNVALWTSKCGMLKCKSTCLSDVYEGGHVLGSHQWVWLPPYVGIFSWNIFKTLKNK